MKQPELNGNVNAVIEGSGHSSGHAKVGTPEPKTLWNSQEVTSWEAPVVYREWADVPVQLVDPAEELSRSVAQLEEMQARLRFMMREIRGMMKS